MIFKHVLAKNKPKNLDGGVHADALMVVRNRAVDRMLSMSYKEYYCDLRSALAAIIIAGCLMISLSRLFCIKCLCSYFLIRRLRVLRNESV